MRKLHVTCVQPVVNAWQSLSTTTATLPHVEFTNAELGKNPAFITTQTTGFPTTCSQLILSNNSVESVVFPIIPRTNKNNNKGE